MTLPRNQIIQGDCLSVMEHWPHDSIDAMITDPPYSSGGFTRADRTAKTSAKYMHTGTVKTRADFSGDNRSQWAWGYWTSIWLHKCWQLVKPSGYAMMFTDWRQLGVAMNSLEAGGFVFRGIITWDKGEGSRPPHTGYFRHQCEYIVWGTKGVSKPASYGGPWPGCYHVPVIQRDKHHQTGKPTELLRKLVEVVPPGGGVLDPFCGSGTTCVAAEQLGRWWIGIELSEEYCGKARSRIAAARAAVTVQDHEAGQASLFPAPAAPERRS